MFRQQCKSRRRIPAAVVILGVGAGLFLGCGQEEPGPQAPGAVLMNQQEYEDWEIALVEMRIEKNDRFSDPAGTPLAKAALDTFVGLNYYFPRAELRFRTPLIPAAAPDTVILAKPDGTQVPHIRRGSVRFHYAGRNHELAVFSPVGAERSDTVWLPFYDATSGKDTYAGGRYLDLTVDPEGMVDLDFNYAYNPYCDYDPEAWICTLPPSENRLPFAVEAGEKTFGGSH